MIHDSLEHIQIYAPVLPYYEVLADFLQHSDWTHLEPGRYTLVEECAYVNVDLMEFRPLSDALLETHDQYIDIQIPLEVGESMGWSSRSACSNVGTAYCSENDITFWKDSIQDMVHVSPSEFVVFFPTDAHAPAIGEGSHRKIVVKLKIN